MTLSRLSPRPARALTTWWFATPVVAGLVLPACENWPQRGPRRSPDPPAESEIPPDPPPLLRSWPLPTPEAVAGRVFEVGRIVVTPQPERPADPLVCSLGATAPDALDAGAASADAGETDASSHDADDADASADAEAPPPGALELPELGRPCGEGCDEASCYLAPLGNPICSRRCRSHAECGAAGACQALGSEGELWCFPRCESDADCLALNASRQNPLTCRPTRDPSDPYLGSDEAPLSEACHSICMQESEP